MVSLLLASNEDSASMNMLSELVSLGGWDSPREFDHGQVTGHSSCDVEILLIDGLHIWADGIDEEHSSLTGSKVDEVLVLSRHVSASETPALTLHAIGVPGEFPHGEKARSGGITGTAVPPSTRFGELFRNMCSDGIGGAYAIWMDTDGKTYATHLTPDSSQIPNPGVGTVIMDHDWTYASISLETAGGGDAMMVWFDERIVGGQPVEDIYSQRIGYENDG